MVKAKFTFDDAKLRKNVRELPKKIDNRITVLVEYHSARGQAYMKTNAPWTDRTGAARTGLHTAGGKTGDGWEIIFAHAVHYGIWLEVKYSGRDQIIMPSVRHTGHELMADLRHLMASL